MSYLARISVAASSFKNNYKTKDVGGSLDIKLNPRLRITYDVIESDKKEI